MREGEFCVCLCCRLFRSLHALVVQGLLLPALPRPRLSVVRERGLLLGVEATEVAPFSAVVNTYYSALLACIHAVEARCWTGPWPR
jgi:hypothetical protein